MANRSARDVLDKKQRRVNPGWRMIFVSLTLLIGCAFGTLAAQATCVPTGDRATQILALVKTLATAIDSTTTALRATLGISPAQANKVTLVTATATCKKAGHGLDKLAKLAPTTTRHVIVVKISTTAFAAIDIRDLDIEGAAVSLFTAEWVYKSTMAM